MSKLLMFIGLPACGKSTVARFIKLDKGDNLAIHSSDELRLELYGSYNVFDKNTDLFKILHDRIISDLNEGKDVIYDATNLTMKRRKYFLSLLPDGVYKEAMVFATEYDTCVERDKKRDKKVGEHVIKKMRESFQFPLETEGFDNIMIHHNSANSKSLLSVHNLFYILDDFDQENHNHTLTLGHHMRKANKLAIEDDMDNEIRLALLFHDIGKVETKTFKNKKEEITDVAHYYNHHNVSAYEFMFYFHMRTDNIKYVCRLINYHMQPYFIETEKSKKKWLAIFGEKMYNDIMLVNKYDRLAH